MWNKNALTQVLGIQWPIVQGPFGGGLSSVALASSVSNLGGLGSFGAHYMTGEQILQVTKELHEKTHNPFAVNLWISDHDPKALQITEAEFEKYRANLKPIYDLLDVALPSFPQKFGERFNDQVEYLFKARPPVFSFVFGIPDKEVFKECRKLGIRTIGTAITVEEAVALNETDVDVIAVSGFEAGGHRGAFLKLAEDSLMGSISLIPQAVDRVNKPVIAAGGIVDGRGIAASLILGASGVQIGTAFLACDESNASAGHKEMLRSKKLQPTALTRAFSGRLARGIENTLLREFGAHPEKIAPFPVQVWLTQKFKAAAIEQKKLDYISLWAGQSYPQIKHTKAADLMLALIEETSHILTGLKS